MSKDEAFGQKYNIQPNPMKGAQASVMARFGRQAQTLAGVGGDGPAVAGESSVATREAAKQATMALGLSKTVDDTKSRLNQIEEGMAGDQIDARAQIERAKIAQRNDVSVIEHMSGGLVAIQQLTGLARAMGKAGGDETNQSVDDVKYQEFYERQALEEMNRAGVQSPDELDQSILERIHKGALDAGRPKQNIFSKGLNAVAGVVEDIPIIGDSMQALRRQNLIESRVAKVAQENVQTADMIRKSMEAQSAFLETATDMLKQRIQIPRKNQQIYMDLAGDFANTTGNYIDLMFPYMTFGASVAPHVVDEDLFNPLDEFDR